MAKKLRRAETPQSYLNTVKATALLINQPVVVLWRDRYDELIAIEQAAKRGGEENERKTNTGATCAKGAARGRAVGTNYGEDYQFRAW